MKKYFKFYDKKFIFICAFVMVILAFLSTYALGSELLTNGITTNIVQIDEDAYGETNFNSSNLDFRPILDSSVDSNVNNVIHVQFTVGGSKFNNADNIIYDIALVDLNLDCSLISSYMKWKLVKNGELISEGSLDYKFDTIVDGRLVLTPIQQDLKEYNDDKSTYDNYDFYMWMSDSCQSENLIDCLDAEDQSNLLGKRLKGKIEVELYADIKRELIRKPSNILNTDYCVVGSGDEIYVNG